MHRGEELKQLRKQAGLSQAEAAELASMSKRGWEHWEQNPETSSYRVPPGWVFAFLRMYILLKSNGIEYESME